MPVTNFHEYAKSIADMLNVLLAAATTTRLIVHHCLRRNTSTRQPGQPFQRRQR